MNSLSLRPAARSRACCVIQSHHAPLPVSHRAGLAIKWPATHTTRVGDGMFAQQTDWL
jgi:hypothetical protein